MSYRFDFEAHKNLSFMDTPERITRKQIVIFVGKGLDFGDLAKFRG